MPRGHSKFHAKQVPSMSVRDYLSRTMLYDLGISKYSHCSNATYVMALIYIDRLQDCLDQLVINKYCIHKSIITNLDCL
jgi:DNA-directed RNA polymerase subunit N (RpoN/RPB10)